WGGRLRGLGGCRAVMTSNSGSCPWPDSQMKQLIARCCATSARGPLRSLANCICVVSGARRGGRYPVGAHPWAVGLAGRLPCDARSEVAPGNSLRSLRSLRSDIPGESEVEARAVRAPTSETALLGAQKSPLPG